MRRVIAALATAVVFPFTHSNNRNFEPRSTAKEPLHRWEYDQKRYRRLQGSRRVFSRFDKLDVLPPGFVLFTLIVDALRNINSPWLTGYKIMLFVE